MAGPTSDRAVLAQLLVDHQFLSNPGRCTCGYRYRLGESKMEHRADAIIAAGFRR